MSTIKNVIQKISQYLTTTPRTDCLHVDQDVSNSRQFGHGHDTVNRGCLSSIFNEKTLGRSTVEAVITELTI
jgi:hypothetical protein